MKTSKEVKDEIKRLKKNLKETEQAFEDYDNYEDMQRIDELQCEIDALKWVLK